MPWLWYGIYTTMTDLKVDWCGHAAAKYACENWHYSKCTPAGKLVKLGVWENGIFIGCVIFSRGANQYLLSPYGLKQTDGCELTRIALNKHATPVSKIMAIAIKKLKKVNSDLKLIVSYSDMDQEHYGTVYQASNWIYAGLVETNGGTPRFKIKGKIMHGRTVGQRGWKQSIEWIKKYIDPKAEAIYTKGKHKYLYPLTEEIRKKITKLSKEYPKRACVV